MRFLLLFSVFLVSNPPTDALNSLWDWENYLPQPRNYNNPSTTEKPSACSNGWSRSNDYGFACPHMMLFSDDMIMASRQDGLDHDFLYAVAGGSSDSDCGQCYQVKLLDAEREWRDNYFQQLIVQVINSGFDVMRGQMDVFMGAGGFGYFTACNSDCHNIFCQGGPCQQAMYDSAFFNWDQAQYSDPNQCYSGGIKWLDQKNESELLPLCQALIGHPNSDPKDGMTVDSCMRSNLKLYHQNFVSANLRAIQCPEHLYKVTGMRRADDSSLPTADITNQEYTIQCRGDRSQGHFCITTMQDCCKPSCAWSGKTNTDPSWPRVDTCAKDGSIYDL